MNNGLEKGTGNPTYKYRTGDVIWRKTSLGSPGVGWVQAGGHSSSDVVPLTKALLGTTNNQYKWVLRNSNFFDSTVRGFDHNGLTGASALWVAVGASRVATSTDAITWVTRNSFLGGISYSVAYGNGTWAIASSNGFRRSTDAITWVTQNALFNGPFPVAVKYGNGVWVVAGSSGAIRTSTDAITWVTRTSNTTNSFTSVDHNGLTGASGLFIAVGSAATLRTSTDGAIWVTQTPQFGSSTINTVAYGNGLWVIGGTAGTLRTSTNTTTWVTRTSSYLTAMAAIYSVGYGNGIWVASGDSGLLAVSTDAITWTPQASNFGTSDIAAVAHNGLTGASGLWVAGGGPIGTIATADVNSVSYVVPDAVPAPPGYTSWFKT